MDKRPKRDLRPGASESARGKPGRHGGAPETPKKTAEVPYVEVSDSGLSPADSDALLAMEIGEVAQRKHRPAARALHDFLQNSCGRMKTAKGEDKTNIIDQGTRTTYALDVESYHRLMDHLEAARMEDSTMHISERQGSSAVLRTGIMIDFDMIVRSRTTTIKKHNFHRLAGAFAARLRKDIDFAAQLPPSRNKEHKIHIFFIVKRSPVVVASVEAKAPSGEDTPAAPASRNDTNTGCTR